MSLVEMEQLKTVPQLKNQAEGFLAMLLPMAEQAVRDFLHRDVEEQEYVEFYSGDGTPQVILKQWPVSLADLEVRFDQTGYAGQRAGGFASGTVLTGGTHYVLLLDAGGTKSHRGIIEAISGVGLWFPGYYAVAPGMNKLAARRKPVWPVGVGNIKVTYTAGYAEGEVPSPIQAAVINVVAFMAANMPAGGILQSEGLGAYNYSRYFPPIGSTPLLGSTAQLLVKYRERPI